MHGRFTGQLVSKRSRTVAASLLSGVLLAGCGTLTSAQSGSFTADTLRIEDAGFSLLRDGLPVRTVTTDAPIAALGSDRSIIVWQLDDDSGNLFILSTDTREANIQTVAAGLEVEAICVGHIEGSVHDLFLADGEGKLRHYWLDTNGEPAMRKVRSLATNPDVAACDLDDERVYFLNPPIGITAYPRDPESDPVMEVVHVASPVGSGSIEATSFRLAQSQEPRMLLLWDKEGQAYAVDPRAPARATRTHDLSSQIPLTQDHRDVEPNSFPSLTASIQTEPVPDNGDAADDPAILVGEAGKVWIIGTNKRQGLHVYDLGGHELHRIDRGRLNNVDAHPLSTTRYLVAASNRTHRTLDLFHADMAADQIEFAAALPLDLDDPYGLCMGVLPDRSLAVFVGGTNGRLQAWSVDTRTLAARLLHEFNFDSQTEGCVYDAESDRLFVGEEEQGIWSVDVTSWEKQPFDGTSPDRLVPDVEGMDIYRRGKDTWLVVSSQGDNTYVLYSLAKAHQPIKFRIGPDYRSGIDGVSETDGLAVSSRSMPGFPDGILVVQDGRNRAPSAPQNFKIVDWQRVAALVPPLGR